MKTHKKKNRLNTLDKVLIACAIFLVIFVIVILIIFSLYQQEPSTLIVSVFGALIGEGGACTMIWKQKEKRKQRNRNKDELEVIDLDEQ